MVKKNEEQSIEISDCEQGVDCELGPFIATQLRSPFLMDVGRDNSVGIATRYGLDGPGIEFRWWARFSAFVQTDPGAHPACYTMGTGSFPEVKRPGLGLDH
jgi:hypothetical protein